MHSQTSLFYKMILAIFKNIEHPPHETKTKKKDEKIFYRKVFYSKNLPESRFGSFFGVKCCVI